MSQKPSVDSQYHKLNSELIIETIDILTKRIHERFPKSGLSKVSEQLEEISRKTKQRADSFSKPIFWLRLPILLLISLFLFIPIYAIAYVQQKSIDLDDITPVFAKISFPEFIQVFEAGANDIIIIGAAIYFMTTFEGRIKRDRALKALHEIRSICHIIDMHQLTKDPERLMHAISKDTSSSPKRILTRFELGRYLDYCSELLSLTGKVAALYIQNYSDPIAIDAVNDIEQLSTGLSQKIWQKIMLLHTLPLTGEQPSASLTQSNPVPPTGKNPTASPATEIPTKNT